MHLKSKPPQKLAYCSANAAQLEYPNMWGVVGRLWRVETGQRRLEEQPMSQVVGNASVDGLQDPEFRQFIRQTMANLLPTHNPENRRGGRRFRH